MNRKKVLKRIVLILLITVLSFSLLSVGFSAVFWPALFPRNDAIPAYALSYDDIDHHAYPREKIALSSTQGELSAFLYPKDSAKGLVVIAGGIGSDCDAHLPEIEYFLDSGYAALCYSCTGVGESEGSSLIGLTQPALDLSAALDYAEGLSLPIVIYGHSAGAHAAAIYADERDIKACVCIAGFDRATQLMHDSAKVYLGLFADIEYPFMCLQNYFVFGSMGFESASENLSRSDIPVLLITGSYDKVVPYSCSITAYSDLQNPAVETLTVDSENRGTHTAIWLSEDSAAYRNSLTDETETIDKKRANTLDDDFMKTVTAFFDKAIA